LDTRKREGTKHDMARCYRISPRFARRFAQDHFGIRSAKPGGDQTLKGHFMNRFLSSTAAVSLALMNVQPWPLMAQTLTDTGSVIAVDGTVLCEPTADTPCDPAAPELIAQAQEIEAQLAAAEAEAATAAQAAAEAEAAAAAQTAAEAEAAAAAQTAADVETAAAAQAAADAEAATAAQAAADAEAATAAQAAADAEAATAAQAAADAEAATAAQAAAEAEAAAAAQAAQAAADAEAAAAAQTAADAEAATAAQAAADAETVAPADPAPEVAPEAAVETATETPPAIAEVSAEDLAAQAEAEAAARAQAEAELNITADGTIVDPAAGLKTAEEVIDPAAPTVAAPVATQTEIQALSDLLAVDAPADAGAVGGEIAAPAAAPAAAALVDTGPAPVDAAPSADAVSSTSEVVTEATSRSATQEFTAAPQVVAPGKKNRLSDLEKAGLVVLGGLAVGAIISSANRTANAPQQAPQQVVSNTGDRVVVLQPDGNYQVFKDDDALLRRPGNEVRTETFSDGSTRTIVDRADGSQIVTIRNATGRVLRRVQYDGRGGERLLINDLAPERPIVVSALPQPRGRPVVISPRDGDAAIKAAIAARQIEQLGRNFSLRQVRDIPQVRRLAAMIDVDAVTFASGSSALTVVQVDALADLGAVMQDLLDANPGEVFLVEGHTDAVGSGALNLALSDRRAETVALALTQYFDIPPENMVVQGYGETELLIDTQANEARNRRVGVRVITPLL
jgi:outer membrane protein OmpA-like peptidoglycan-associated protein